MWACPMNIMKILSSIIIFSGFFSVNQAQTENYLKTSKIEVLKIVREPWKPSESKITNNEQLFEAEWPEDGSFGKKFKPNTQNNLKNVELVPSQALEPPFPYYSSSLRDLETENFRSTTIAPFLPSKNSASGVKRLRIYEITQTSTEQSFVISNPSVGTQSIDSLRSVFTSGSLEKPKNVGELSSFDDKSQHLNSKTSVIRTNPLKGYPLRGNRKYQHHESDSDEISARKNLWGDSRNRYSWIKARPTNHNNHLRFIDSSASTGAVPGVPGRDYPIHQEHIHLQLRNTAKRFTCPANADSHIYLADRASRCQIFYVCFGTNIGIPMVCPNGTLFSQELQVCDWWFNVIC